MKEQVLTHAEGSEAVKNSSAFRMLLYTVAVVIILGASVLGYVKWQEQEHLQQLQNQITTLQDRTESLDQNPIHGAILDDISSLLGQKAVPPLSAVNSKL